MGNIDHLTPCSVNRCNTCGNMGLILWNDVRNIDPILRIYAYSLTFLSH